MDVWEYGCVSVLCLLLAGILGACASQQVGNMESAQEASKTEPAFAFEQVVAPFEVRGADGTPYDHPFLGGLNVPRPQFVDIDGDDDLDLFVQEATGDLKFFEQVGTPTAPRYIWRTDRYRDLDIGEWYRFVDMDADGDMDLLGEERFSYIRYYRNDGTPQQPAFSLAADTLRDASGKALFSDRQNIPYLVDIDCNDKLDLFIGRVTGTVMRYESAGLDENNIPRFQLLTERFQDIEIIGQVMGSLHGANTMAFADIEGDGDLDLFWGDFFEPGLLFLENLGTCATPTMSGTPIPFPTDDPLATSGYNDPVFADYDGDGDLDLFVGVLGGAFNPNVTAADNFYLLEATPDGFELHTRRFLSGIDVGSESLPTFADLDTDGDLDLLLSNKIDSEDNATARLYYFENEGTPTQPSFQLADTLGLEPAFHYAPALTDLDADGDLDLLVGTWNKDIALYRNEGTPEAPNFVLENPVFIELTRGSHNVPSFVDIDADGDMDLFVGEASGELNFYRNDGTPDAPNFVLVTDNYAEIDVGRRSVPRFADLDDDDDLDLLLGTEAGPLAFYRNTGTAQAAFFVPDSTLSLPTPAFSTPTFADIDNDGDPDFFSGGISGGVLFYANRKR